MNVPYRGRERTGCLACRASKVRCDEQDPVCKRCIRRQKPCVYTKRRTPAAEAATTPDAAHTPPSSGEEHVGRQIHPIVASEEASNSRDSPPLDHRQGSYRIGLDDHYASSTPTVETPSTSVRSPSVISSLISQDIYLCTTIDLLAASEGSAAPSLTHFHQTVESPFVTPYDPANWTVFKGRVIEAAAHCSAVASAALAVQELYKARRNCLSHSKALPLYHVASETFEELISSGQVSHGFDLVFMSAFLLSLFEMLVPQDAHHRPLAQGHGPILDQLKMWSTAKQFQTPFSLRMAAWLLISHAAARRSGNPGLLSTIVHDVLVSACNRHPQLPPLDKGHTMPLSDHLISTLSDPLFTFYYQLQLLSTKVADLSHYHRSRTTGADQEEVSVLMSSLQAHVEALWRERPTLMRHPAGELGAYLASPVTEHLSRLATLCALTYHTELVEIGRNLSDTQRASPDAEAHMAEARMIICSLDYRPVNLDGNDCLDPAYLRALFLCAIESFNEAETRWAVSRIREIKDPVCYNDTQYPQRTAIGLSFGNSYSSIAHTADGKTEVIANEEGDRQIPSILSYVSGEEFQGAQAKVQLVRNPRNTIAYFRDLLGRKFKDVDPSPCHASAHPVESEGEGVAFVVQEKAAGEDEEEGEKSTLTVAEITTRHLRKLKESATDYLGKDVNAAVITVPSDFADAQKTALSESASKAGIEVLQFITEPISALLAYDAKQQAAESGSHAPQDKIVVVADLGGTRSDVAVVASRGGIYTTLATAHDYELGGSSLDKILIEHAAKEFQKKNKSASDPRKNDRSLAKLTLEAEAVKKALGLGATASFSIESLGDGIDFNLTVNRSRFELLANKVLMSFTRLIESAVQKADLDILDVDEILLSGGTSHTPKIASNLQSHFPESAVVIAPATSASAINPSELTARGAAIQASLISGFEVEEIGSSTEAVVTVTPHLQHAIGLVTGEDGFAVIVPAETPAPVRRTAQVVVKQGGDVLVRLAEGVREISVRKEDKSMTNGNGKKDDEDDDDDDEDDEPEEVREKVWKAGKVLAEAGIRGVKKGGKVEVQVNVAADLSVTVVCREVGSKGGVRGTVPAGKAEQNGSA
ncbi:Hsp70 protein that interacts with Zuo1p [Friedmanniomyces endolithicus]|nr:Hsp70 protein that interacts with Zuo1p [Friedmanniomyces endolithicus]